MFAAYMADGHFGRDLPLSFRSGDGLSGDQVFEGVRCICGEEGSLSSSASELIFRVWTIMPGKDLRLDTVCVGSFGQVYFMRLD